MTDVVNRSSADESEEKQHTMSLTENSPTSGGIESEYDTASTNSRSDNERDEYEDSEEESLDEEGTDDEDEVVDDERESGDGQEELESESGAKKKVDHDEDRSNPQYIPKKGTFYEHDDRTAEDLDAEGEETPENANNSTEGLSGSTKVLSTQNQKVTPKQVKKVKDTADRWSHDRFNEYEQAPKSRSELVSAYGYDIRNEDCPPRPRRQRRYGRHQIKYSRNWEDENAYKKTQAAIKPPRRPLKPEDFPALGSTKDQSSSSSKLNQRSRRRRPQDENDPQSSINYRSPVRNRDLKPRDERSSRDQRNQRYNNDNSNNNNARHVKGKKNINFNHNIEFKNQNRKNINYESTQTKNNNVLNQQMQSTSSHQTSSSHQHNSHSSSQGPSSHHQQQNQVTQRFNNNEAPLPTLSFTNSKMNNATTNSSSVTPTSSRTILNFDNSSGNYGRTSREKEVNSQHQQMHTQISNQQQQSAMSPNKNIQYTEHQMDQMKLMEKNYQQQQGKATNLNLNQGPPSSHQQINNMPDPSQSMINNSDMSRSKRYSSLRQRSNLNEGPQTQQSQQYHPQYHQQEIDPQHVQNVMPAQQTPTYIPQQQQAPPPQTQPSIMATQPPPPQPATNVQTQQAQKYQAAYYAANPASEYAAQQAALMQAAMVEKYQYTQQTPPAQYLPPQQAPQIYMPTQTPPTQQQQILNYVSTIQPQAPAAAYPQYTNYQNYNIPPQPAATVPPPQQAPPPAQTQPQPIYQTQGGLTYYPNTQMQTAHQQRIIQPQRRPNPIPILAPPDHKSKTSSSNADDDKSNEEKGGTGSAENIDHILDNMFVQRPMTNIISLKDPTPVIQNDNKNEDQINDGMNSMSITDGDIKGDGSK
ncbi:hypothetical protein ACKWTF_010408 [Chironomus riparius]